MAVFRVERTKDYTVMSNYHLRDKNLSLKAKGLLSQMLSLPEDWDYTLAGLSHINRESKDAIRSAINELENAGYVQRRQTTDASGKFGANEYIIHEYPVSSKPSLEKPLSEKPSSENPTTDNPSTGKPSPENPTQLNTKRQTKDKLNTDIQSTDSFLSFEDETQGDDEEKGNGAVSMKEIINSRDKICENIGYERLKEEFPYDGDTVDEIVELMVEVVCAKRKSIRVAGSDFPNEVVKARFLRLDFSHVRFVMECMKENTTKIRNIKQYLLTVLYNAPITISNYYSAMVNHDMYGGG